MNYVQQFDCKEWQFENIPTFHAGKMDPLFADSGAGLFTPEGEPDDSFFHIFTDVSAEDITNYSAELENKGFRLVFQNEKCGNLFYIFSVSEGSFCISYMKNSSCARFILDRCRCCGLDEFGYDDYDPINENTLFAQYSLYYHHMIRGTTCDCGMNYVFRLRDNSLIIIDGGEMEQSTDEAIEDYLRFLRELTGTETSEKLRISLWLCTHAHNDHCDFMSKLLRFYSDEFVIERAAFNFPEPSNIKPSDSVELLRSRLSAKFPEIKYSKLHSGAKFNIANAEIEVFVSNEDTTGLDPEDPFPGMNAASIVFGVTADGVKALFLADCGEENGSVLINNYDASVTDCDFLQAAHHGINRIYDVYERINAKYVLLPQCRMNMDTRFAEIFSHLCERFGEEYIYLAAARTDVFTLANGIISSASREHVGGAYDGSEW